MRSVAATLILVSVGSLSAFAAVWMGWPLPYLLGPLLISAMLSLGGKSALPEKFAGLEALRFGFTAVIGMMIGTQVTPELFANPAALGLSIAALTLFVICAIALNFTIFHRLGRYDRATAFYSSMPGGLYESIAFGEQAGANTAQLALQQFLRVIAVVTLVPIGLSLWTGEVVGSASGITLAKPDVPWSSLPIVFVAMAVGVVLGRAFKLPARQLTGPMAVGAFLSLTGLIDVDVPQWLIDLAQVIIGTALGTRFKNMTIRRVAQGLGLAIVSVLGMLVISGGMASALHYWTGQPFDMLLIAFAPGGVTEMTLIALSLTGNPALVTLHHICRILITVVVLVLTARRLRERL